MSYKPGDKIFTKVKGFRHWPCRINPLPKEVVVPSGKYPIFFYGSHEVMFLSGKDIFPFESNLEKWGKKPGPPQFNLGMNEIINNPTLFQYGIDPDAESFLAQFYDFPFIGASDAVAASAKEPTVIPQIEPKSTRKRSKTSSNKTASKLPKMSTEVSSGHKSQIKTADSHENANMDQSSETSSDDSKDDDFVPVKKKRTSGSSQGKTRSGPKKKKAPPKSRESVSKIRRWEAASDVSSLSSEEDVPLVKLTDTLKPIERASNASEERSVSSSLHLPTEMNSEGLQSAASVEPAKSISPDLPLLFTEEKTPLDQPQEPLVEIVPEKHPNQPEVSQPASDAILTNSSSRNVGEDRRKSKQKKVKQKKEKKKRPVIPSDSESDTDSPRKVSEDPVHHPELPPASEAAVTSNTPLATEDADNNSRTVQDSSEHKSSTSTHKKNSNTTKPNNSVPVKVKSHSTSIESRLRMVDATIKRCLIRGSEDFPRCLSVMKELNDLPIRLSDLAKCCELMATLKKCRKYRLNDEIKSMAQHVYNRFLEIPTDATHEEVSMASRCIQQQQKVVESTRQTKAVETIVSMSPVLVSKKEDIPLLEELKVDTTTMPEKQLLPVSIVSHEVYVVDLDSDKSTEVVPVASAPIAAAANNDEDDERSFAELLKNIPGFELATSTLGFGETSVMETGDSGGLLFPPSTTSVSLPSAPKEGSLKRLLQPGSHPVAQPVATEWPTENLVRERKEKHKFHRNHRRLGSSNSSRSSSSSSSSRSSSSSNSSRSSRSSLATPDVEPTTLTSNGSHAMHEPSTGPITGATVTSSVLDLDSRIQQLIQAGTGAPPHPPPSNTSSRHRASNNSIQVAHSRPYSIISKLPLPPGVTKRDLLPPPSTNVNITNMNTNTPLGPLFPTSGIDAPSTAHHTASHNNRTTVNDEDIYNLLGV